MADFIEELFDEPFCEYARARGHQAVGNKYAFVAFLAQQGFEADMSLEEVAGELGKSPAHIAHILQAAGVACLDWDRECAFRRGLFGPIFRATDAQAAEICGVSVGAMGGWRARNGIPVNSPRKAGVRHG